MHSRCHQGFAIRPRSHAIPCLLALVVLAGCASTEVTERQRYEGEKLARPERIIVHDFTANPAEVPPESAFAAELAGAPTATPEQLEVGGRLGAQVAKEPGGGAAPHGSAGGAGGRRAATAAGRHRAAGLFRLGRRGPGRKAACWWGSAPARPS